MQESVWMPRVIFQNFGQVIWGMRRVLNISVPCCQAVSAVCNISDGRSRLRVASERHTQQYMVLKVFSPRSLACRAEEEGSGELMHEDTSSPSFLLQVPVQHLPFCAVLCIISLPSDS